ARPTSAQGETDSNNSTYIYYGLRSGSTSTDSIPYTGSGTNGCSTSASIGLSIAAPGGIAQTISSSGGSVTVNFAGIPGYQYDVQRATNVSFTNVTVVLTTNTP